MRTAWFRGASLLARHSALAQFRNRFRSPGNVANALPQRIEFAHVAARGRPGSDKVQRRSIRPSPAAG